jgi:hypothetical protein
MNMRFQLKERIFSTPKILTRQTSHARLFFCWLREYAPYDEMQEKWRQYAQNYYQLFSRFTPWVGDPFSVVCTRGRGGRQQ